MADVCIVADAIELTCVAPACQNQLADLALVAACTVVVQCYFVMRTNSEGLGKILQGEAFGMPESVLCLGNIFGEKRLGRMAVIARGNAMMTRFLPAIVLLVHDVAVHADLEILGKTRRGLRRPNEVAAKANERA